MGARGPLLGSGEVSAWVVGVLKRGNAATFEMRMGSPFTRKQIQNCVDRMVAAEKIEVAPGYRVSESRRLVQVYRLVETNVASKPPVYPARARRTHAVRDLADAFARIVEQRPASA